MDVFGDNITSNNEYNFLCVCCDFKCNKKGDWNRHNLTKKHINNLNKKCDDNKSYICNYCDKKYESRNGLWVHKKTCSHKNEEQNTKQMLAELLKQNNDIRNKLLQLTSQP